VPIRRLAIHAAVAAALAAAACGGGVRDVIPPSSSPSPAPAPAAAASPAPAGASSTPAPAAPGSSSAPAPALSPAAAPEGSAPVASTMLPDLERLGLDPTNLPPIEKLDPKALRGVMKLISRSLGARCGDCHQEGDFAARTPRKMVAAKMWDEYVVKLAFAADGAPLFCDSCHRGRTKSLDRTDKKATLASMTHLVESLKRKDEKDHGCETCHVGPDMRFLDKWAGGVAL
jgi:Cytochrome c7 and related cytochrome c